MSLFLCTTCGCVENTACCAYWSRKDMDKPICSECDPRIGQWHGRFPKRVPDPATVKPNALGVHFIDIMPAPTEER
jgi:hypothetical protein